jgi:hypothetical protein
MKGLELLSAFGLALLGGRPPAAHPKTGLATLIEVLLFVGGVFALLAITEILLARGSRWRALAEVFRAKSTPGAPWKAATFLHMEYTVGRTIHITRYQPGYRRSLSSLISSYFFPLVSVAAPADALYLKRPPWKFAHRPLAIPWSAIARAEELSQTEYAALTSDLRLLPGGPEAMKGMLGKSLPRFLDTVGGPVLRLYIEHPEVIISLPAAGLSEARRHFESKVTARAVETRQR